MITANLLALKLFKDELGVTFVAMFRLSWAIVRQLALMIQPMAILAIPMMLVVAQMAVRYQWRPLLPGEPAQIHLHLAEGAGQSSAVALEPNAGITVEAVGPGARDVVWRVRGAAEGRHALRFSVNGQSVEKELVVGRGLQRVSAERTAPRWTAQLLHPVEPPIPSATGVESIEIKYPGQESYIYGAGWWILYFFVVSMVFALLFKPLLKVKF